MALTKCSECKQDVSSQATTCPHCGYPLTASQNKTSPSGLATPPPINSATSVSSKMSKAKLGCLVLLAIIAVFGLLVIIGAFISEPPKDQNSQTTNTTVLVQGPEGDISQDTNKIPGSLDTTSESPQDVMPKSVVITSGLIVFRKLSDLEDFQSAAVQITSANGDAFVKAHPNGATDADMKAFGEQTVRDVESLKAKFVADNRTWNVPLETKIEIVKFYDKNGEEITPVWNDAQKTAYAPAGDGGFVFPSGEWEGRTVYILNNGGLTTSWFF